MTVLAVDPSESFDGIESTVGELVEEFSERYVAPGWDAEAASLVRTRRSIIRHLEGVIGSAEYELAVALTPDLLERFEDGLRERREDGCHVSLLLFPSSEAPSPETYDYGSVSTVARARRGVTSPVMAVADGAHSVYATREALSDSDRYGVIFQQSILGFLVYGFYTTMLATTAELVYDGSDDRPWPRRYASIRQCIRDVREGYRITVEGRDVETGDLRRVEGTVADTRMDASGGVATLTVATADGEVTVGGRMAALEDVEAHTVVADR